MLFAALVSTLRTVATRLLPQAGFINSSSLPTFISATSQEATPSAGDTSQGLETYRHRRLSVKPTYDGA